MNIYDYLTNHKSTPSAFSEADDFGMGGNEPDSFSDFIPEGADDPNIGAQGDDFGDMGMGGMDDGFGMGMDDGMMMDGDGQGGQQSVKSLINDYIDSLEESEKNFVERILQSFGDLYEDRKNDYQRLKSENLDSSDVGMGLSKVRDQYESTLSILRVYILEKCLKDTTYARTMAFIEFKNIFNDLNKTLNDLLNNYK